MARRKSKKKSSNKLLKTVILLALFIGLWFIYQQPAVQKRINEVLHPHKPAPTAVQTVPEPEVTQPKSQQGVLPPPEPVVTPPSTKNVTYTVKNPQFDNLSYGVPGKADSIVEREGYALGYIEKHEQPAWVQYIMTSEEVSRRAAKRGDDFRPDPDVPTGSATPQDYTRSGYDRGHLAPAADMSFSVKTMSESFFMSNMSPQTPELNRGVWKDLEAQVRDWVKTFGRAYVVSGPVLNKKAGEFNSIGENQVAIPEYYYKVVLVPLYEDEADRKSMDDAKAVMAIGFVIPNQGCEDNFWRYAVPVDEVEVLTNLDFFAILEDAEEDKIEAEANPSKWENTY